jgi:serine/threonine protein kinase
MHLTDAESNDVTVRMGGSSVRLSSSTEFLHRQVVVSSTEFQQGQVVGGRYEVISRLGKGGMGLVYRVKQIFINKEFALKTIDRSCMSAIAVRRFQQEAKTAFSLDHPNIIAVNDFGVLDDQTPFLVMELINGETLGERLTRTGCLKLEQAIPIFVQVCFGLAYAHECGVVHRDIKPNNIMLLKGLPLGVEGSVKILDFGIAKFTAHAGGEIQALTQTGEIFGSPLYMSPEQCGGLRVDNRADIYSLGCVFFEALTGAPPFVGETALVTMRKHESEAVPTLKQASLGGEFPAALETIITRMLAKSPDERYQNLGSVAHDLGALLRGDKSATSSFIGTEPRRELKRISISQPSFYALMFSIALLSAALGGAVGYWLHTPAKVSALEQPEKVLPAQPIKAFRESDLQPKALKPQELAQMLEACHNGALQINSCTLTDDSFELIAKAKSLRQLSMTGCNLPNPSLAKLAKIKLSVINFHNSNFNDTGAENLCNCQSLEEVNAQNTEIRDPGLRKLATLKNLRKINIGQTNITDKGLAELAKCKKLESIFMTGMPQITSDALKLLAKFKIREIELDYNRIEDSGLVYLSKIGSLEKLSLKGTNVTRDGVMKFCQESKNCSVVVLTDCQNIGNADIKLLKEAFRERTFIREEKKHTGLSNP